MPDLTAALGALEGGRRRVLEHLDALVGVDTSMPPGERYPTVAKLLEARLKALGFACERVEVPESLWRSEHLGLHGPRVNLVARRPRGRPPLSIYGHTDVVPVDPSAWIHPPFRATLDGDFAYGRGASDMKGAIAALLLALETAVSHGIALAYDPVLLLCTDEEGGTYPGIRYLAEKGYVEGHLLCMDGHAAPRLWAGCCGLADFRITVRGVSSHSGSPELGTNAIERAIPLLNRLMTLKAEVASRRSAMPAAPGAPHDRIGALLNVTVARGGEKATTVPASFTIDVDRRYLPEETLEEVRQELERTVCGQDASDADVRVELIAHLPPVHDPLGPHWPRWQAAMQAGFEFDTPSFRAYGASSSSDMGWAQAAGTKEILLGGVGRSDNNIHGPDERVAVADLLGFARTLLCYLAADFAPGEGIDNAQGEST